MESRPFAVVLAILAMLFIAPTSFAATLAGHVSELEGHAYGKAPGEKFRRLKEGDPVYSGDDIRTIEHSSIGLQFLDKSRFSLGAKSRMIISDFKYQHDDSQNTLQTKIVTGVFRFFSGLIAKKHHRAMSVSMPVATIGIRGTHVVGEVHGTSASVALLDPEVPGTKTAIEVSNSYGSVVIDQPGYGTDIPDDHSPPSPPHRVEVNRINNLLRSIQTIRRLTVPRPPPMHIR
jgi:hypothetical protein